MQKRHSQNKIILNFIVALSIGIFPLFVAAQATEAAQPDKDDSVSNKTATEEAAPTTAVDEASPASEDTAETGDTPNANDAESTNDTSAQATDAAVSASESEKTIPSVNAEASAPVADEPPAEAAPAADKDEKKSWTDHFSLKGDFRYRLELIDIPDVGDTKLRHRHRVRGRLGVNAKMSHGFNAGVQLATGSDDPRSTNQTLDNAFSTKPLWIDLAYVSWTPEFLKGLVLVGGKMKNPFRRPVKSELVWDGDLNPEGLALGYEGDFGIVSPYIQTGGFFIDERKKADDSWLLGVQAGLKLNFADGLFHVAGGVGYFDQTSIKGNEVYYDSEDSFGNTPDPIVDPDDPDAADLAYLYDYNLVEGYLELGGKIVRFPWAVFGNVVKNVAEDVDDDFGWLVGVKLGKAKKPLTFDIRYIYRVVESDAVVGAFTDSDFMGGNTNGRGHEWNVGFQVIEPMKIAASFFYNKTPAHDEDDVDTEDYRRFQLDFQFKF